MHVLPVSAADEIPAMKIVDVAIIVVVAAVTRYFLWICPQIRAQVDVGRIDTAVDDGDEHRTRRPLAGEQLALRPLGADARHAVDGFVKALPVALGLRGGSRGHDARRCGVGRHGRGRSSDGARSRARSSSQKDSEQ